jgi:hypothetical protein
MEGTLWTFDNHLLLPHRLKEGEAPGQIYIHNIEFWIECMIYQWVISRLGLASSWGIALEPLWTMMRRIVLEFGGLSGNL